GAPLLLPDTADPPGEAVHRALLDALDGDQALFFRALAERVAPGEADLAQAVWDLVWSGWLTNDTIAPVRALLGGGNRTAHARRPPGPPPPGGPPAPAPGAPPPPGAPRPARRRPALRRRWPAGGRGCRPATSTRPGAPWPRPRCCSTDTAS